MICRNINLASQETLHEKFDMERNRAVEQERGIMRDHFRRVQEKDELDVRLPGRLPLTSLQFQNKERRLLNVFEEEKKTLLHKIEEAEAMVLRERAVAEDKIRRFVDSIEKDKETLVKEERRHAEYELSKERQQLQMEKEEWQTRMMARQAQLLKEKEATLQATVKAQNERELDFLIAKFDGEKEELKKEHRMELDSIQKLHDNALEEVKATRNVLLEKMRRLEKELQHRDESSKTLSDDVRIMRENIRAKVMPLTSRTLTAAPGTRAGRTARDMQDKQLRPRPSYQIHP